jgi:hypothetical protein
MNPLNYKCLGESDHSSSISLEAVTPKQYNYVEYIECYRDTTRFGKITAELMKFSNVDQGELDWEEKQRELVRKKLQKQGT